MPFVWITLIMRLIGILFILCLCVSIGSCFSLGSIFEKISSLFKDPLNQVKEGLCIYFNKNPDRLTKSITALNQCVEKYDKTKQAFNTTLTYLNSNVIQQALVSNTTQCLTALDGLYTNLSNDLKNKGYQTKEALTIFTDYYNKIKN